MCKKQEFKPREQDCHYQGRLDSDDMYCIVHKQSYACCQQMIHGNLCHKCLEWHTGVCQEATTTTK